MRRASSRDHNRRPPRPRRYEGDGSGGFRPPMCNPRLMPSWPILWFIISARSRAEGYGALSAWLESWQARRIRTAGATSVLHCDREGSQLMAEGRCPLSLIRSPIPDRQKGAGFLSNWGFSLVESNQISNIALCWRPGHGRHKCTNQLIKYALTPPEPGACLFAADINRVSNPDTLGLWDHLTRNLALTILI